VVAARTPRFVPFSRDPEPGDGISASERQLSGRAGGRVGRVGSVSNRAGGRCTSPALRPAGRRVRPTVARSARENPVNIFSRPLLAARQRLEGSGKSSADELCNCSARVAFPGYPYCTGKTRCPFPVRWTGPGTWNGRATARTGGIGGLCSRLAPLPDRATSLAVLSLPRAPWLTACDSALQSMCLLGSSYSSSSRELCSLHHKDKSERGASCVDFTKSFY